ncbi:glycosyltransferase family 4 protein [Poseidonocella sp. HB161398]|uniref:glycosyltransferase family 4 protein n=1 Tax=Poseidonocella sp. HB161398 TaxID=2320855 RepID=UPI001109911F|nr:glycosyltransferase family 4 protein [Poseidonocella sp. HB161398]
MSVDVQFLSFRPMLGHGTTEIRCAQPAAFLRQAGLSAATAQLLDAPAARCRLLVLHRVRMSPILTRVVALARSRQTPVVYDIDDLILDGPAGTELSPAIVAALQLADAVSVSGGALQARIAPLHPDTRILRNKLSRPVLDAGRLAPRSAAADGAITIGYFSGSAHHDADFAMIAPALRQILRELPQTRLMVAGKIAIDPAFAEFGDRVRVEPFRPYAEFVSLLGQVDINLAPLDLGSDFAGARSELKYLEAAAFAVPTIASPSIAFSDAIEDGRTGLLAQPGAWHAALRALCGDPALRERLGAAARAHVERQYGPEAGAAEWSDLFASLAGAPRPRPDRLADLQAALSLRAEARANAMRSAAKSGLRRLGALRT